MRPTTRLSGSPTPATAVPRLGLVIAWSVITCCAAPAVAAEERVDPERPRQFQRQEIITARPNTWIFSPGETPRLVWRDVEAVRAAGADGVLKVRWFDADLNEAEGPPARPGRWGAWIEGTAPNGMPLRRALTFYCRPPGFLFFGKPGALVRLLPAPAGEGPAAATQPAPGAAVWHAHEAELDRAANDLTFRGLNDSEAGAILLSGVSESPATGRAAREVESLAVRNDDYHLALKLKVLGLRDKVRPLREPRVRAAGPAPVLRAGTAAEARVAPGTAERIEAICRAWADDSGEPFVTLVARDGVIVTHAAFGRDGGGRAVDLDYRGPLFSITKTITGILFGQFVDQGSIGLDDPLSAVFPDYPRGGPASAHVPTFRQCLTHTSGLAGHGEFGGVRNAHLSNVVLNAIEANRPGAAYAYSGTGFELVAEAMATVAGKSWRRVYEDHLFAPLGFGDVPMSDASAGASHTARELATLGQWMANRGSYGEREFVSPSTFERLLPEPVKRRWPTIAYDEDEGIGNHWMRVLRPGATPGSSRAEDRLFSDRLIGHGSLSASIFLVDLEHGLVIAQVRKQPGPRFAEWSGKFFQAIADGLK